jgi:DNA (cytosine-5)-methyltransferase 1
VRTNHKLLDLFSGIGGFSLGAERNGIETIGFIEKDEFCQKVLKKHWSDVPIIDDIRKVNGKDFGAATIISGGFPCQPFSVAGKREGTDDDRYLWPEMLRVISEVKPRWVIGENVQGIINIEDGMVLRQVHNDLESEGFKVQCFVIPASGIGAWHQRNRVWIVAHSNSNCESRCSQYVQERSRELGESHVCDSQHNGSSTTKEQRGNTQTATGSQKRENSSLQSERTNRPTDNGNVSNTSSIRGSHTTADNKGNGPEKFSKEDVKFSIKSPLRNNVSNTDSRLRSRRGTIKESGEKPTATWWQTESKLRGVPNGVSYELHSNRADRIKALGNSIVPQIAEQIFRSIIDAE